MVAVKQSYRLYDRGGVRQITLPTEYLRALEKAVGHSLTELFQSLVTDDDGMPTGILIQPLASDWGQGVREPQAIYRLTPNGRGEVTSDNRRKQTPPG